ncbi:MAG: pyrroloquinoline quinone biosynthesis protein PqqE [Pseudomonadota bacterium]
MLAELTHRCPLRCLYCSNPIELTRRSDELRTQEWRTVFQQAADLGVLQVHLSGGEPAARQDIADIVSDAAASGLYTNLITSGVGLSPEKLDACVDAGLDHVQLSVQAADEPTARSVSGYSNAMLIKRSVAEMVVSHGVPLTINAVVHRLNLYQVEELIDLAHAWGARRIEIAHTQYHGWALTNRATLMPSLEQVIAATEQVERARAAFAGAMAIDYVKPDHFARYPKACMGGWGRTALNVAPDGKVLPCHAAETIPGLIPTNVRDRDLAYIWRHSATFEMFRGTDWMKEPCRSCPRKEIDFGGCRCQAYALTGNAAATDPTCEKADGYTAVLQNEWHSPPREPIPVYRGGSPRAST